MINKLHAEMIKLYAGDPKRIQHFCKVHSYAKLIAELENVDEKTRFILETAALTHDIGIHICEQKYGDCGVNYRNRKVGTGATIACQVAVPGGRIDQSTIFDRTSSYL